MRHSFFIPFAILLVLFSAMPLVAQSKADEKELASYTLTMATLNKVVAATRAMSKEMLSDPKFQQMRKLDDQIASLEKELEVLEAKDELSKADEAKLESLNAQIDKAREAKDQAEESMSAGAPNMSNAQTLDDMERGLAAIAPMARALKSAGLTPREYAKFTMAMLQAGMIHGFSKGKVDYAKLPAGVNPENIKFIEAHQAELAAMQKEFAALNKRQD